MSSRTLTLTMPELENSNCDYNCKLQKYAGGGNEHGLLPVAGM